MFKYLEQIWNSQDLRKKILITIGLILAYRLLAQISIPGANLKALRSVFESNQLLGTFSLLTGGSAHNFSIILMGLSPYINASIIIQLLAVISPKLDNLSKEGDAGRRTLNQYTRILTIPIALLQSYGMVLLLNSQSQLPIIQNTGDPHVMLPIMLTVTTGTIVLMWLGELISEMGFPNGISIIILAGIIANIPAVIGKNLALANESQQFLIPFVIMVLITLILTSIVVIVTEGERKIPILYASRGIKAGGEKSNLPLRVNMAGMIPIIFALSVISFPGITAQLMQNSSNPILKNIAGFLATNFNPNTFAYTFGYFLLVIMFTFFYVSITFNPEQVAENIQKRGGYIPGIRPGKQTVKYLAQVTNRLNLWGGLFIGIIAIIPNLLQNFSSSLSIGVIPTLISGAGMIIIVSVVLELIQQVNAQMVMHDYNKLF